MLSAALINPESVALTPEMLREGVDGLIQQIKTTVDIIVVSPSAGGAAPKGDPAGMALASLTAARLNVPLLIIPREPDDGSSLSQSKISEPLPHTVPSKWLSISLDSLPRTLGRKALVVGGILGIGTDRTRTIARLLLRAGLDFVGASFVVANEESITALRRDGVPANGHIIIHESVPLPDKKRQRLPQGRSTPSLPGDILFFTWPPMKPLESALVHPPISAVAPVQWNTFETGWPNITFLSDESAFGRHAVFLGSLYRPHDVIQQASLCIALPRNHVKSLTMVFPFFGPGTMERVDREGMLATAETVAKLFSAPIPMTTSGPPTLIIFDIHALQERFYFSDNVRPRLVSAIPILHQQLEKEDIHTIVVFPDDGACKRFSKLVGLPYVVCGKVRDGSHRFIRIMDAVGIDLVTSRLRLRPSDPITGPIFAKESDCKARFLIVDDLVNSGGTLVKCAEALRLNGAERIDAFVTHPVFGNDSWTRFAYGDHKGVFEKFYVTDTIPEVSSRLTMPPFTVLGIAGYLWTVLNDIVRSY